MYLFYQNMEEKNLIPFFRLLPSVRVCQMTKIGIAVMEFLRTEKTNPSSVDKQE